ncbi:MAG: hypothetical protein Q4D05_09385 [Acinetobacter sp.]|nr:hypothetical protein [Acinetobacter sp.]
MIEIAIQDIQKYDMEQVLNVAMHGERVFLTKDGQKFSITPYQDDQVLTLDELFKQVKGTLPKDYRFDRDEANER